MASIRKNSGRPEAVETWFRKAIEADRALGNPKEIAPDLSNLADLLRIQMQLIAPVVLAFVSAVAGDEAATKAIQQLLGMFRSNDDEGIRCADALEQLMAGERDAEVLCAELGPDSAMIIETILAGLADPSTLSDLLPPGFKDGHVPYSRRLRYRFPLVTPCEKTTAAEREMFA